MKVPNAKTHMGWAIAALAAMLIGSLSVSWSDLPNIPNIISIALGLSSLVLALVAIIQGVSGANNLLSSLAKIEGAAERALTATQAVDEAAEQLNAKAGTFDSATKSIESIRSEIAALNDSRSPATANDGHSVSSNSAVYDQADIFEQGTVGSGLALYIALISFKHNKSFACVKMFTDNPFIGGLMEGYLVGLRSARIMDISYIDGSMLVRSLGPFSEKAILENISDEASKPISDLKASVEKYFEITGA